MRKLALGVLVLTGALILAAVAAMWLRPSPIDVQPLDAESAPLSLDGYESSLLVPISITAARLAQILDEQLPRFLDGTEPLDLGDNFRDAKIDYTVDRGAVAFRADDGRVRFSAPLTGRATGSGELCPLGGLLGCSGISESADLGAVVNGTLSNIRLDPDWVVRTDPVRVDVEVTQAEVRLLGDLIPISFRTPLQRLIERQLPDVDGELRRLLEGVDLPSRLEAPWGALHRTVRLSDEPQAWLAVEPRSVGVSPVAVSDDRLTVSVVLSAAMAVNFGDRPAVDRQPLRLQPMPDDARPAFRLEVPVVADLDDLAAELEACCTPVSIPVPGGGSATLSNVTMAEYRGLLLLGTDFALSGWWAPRGTVHLLGNPALEGNTLRLGDLDFSVESSSVLTALAVGPGRGLILDRLQAALRIDMTEYLEEARTVLDATVAELEVGHGVDLRIEIGDVRLADVRAGDGMLVAVAEVSGTAVAEVGAL